VPPGHGGGAGPYEPGAIFDKSKPLAWNSDFGTKTTLTEAERRAKYPLYRPEALEGSNPEVWVSRTAREIALRYDSNLVVHLIPIRIPRDPAETYRSMADEMEGTTATTIAGNPALVLPVNSSGPGNPPIARSWWLSTEMFR
jgi:hypothetical protein